ncbi:MBL fold metallo-hydrolase [Fumia xinanensis]|uniref:Metallo-beta-lactamase domain-containing protein n=1 Tax=Fumia xinanensis TaxID=2763659 RepID=A0A926E570_9FIRM|nr:MBL fold metallo-hydrolase [Fumia xinanensis]MBC8559928.1 hypothetical protein [Fumia xinanensis]
MKIKYLGTAASEGWPAVFCRCKYCLEAKKRGGKDIRTRSQALINDDLMLDWPADTYAHSLHHSIDLSAVKYLFITHPHSDHFYPSELVMRGGPYGHDMASENLNVYSSYHAKNFCYQYAGMQFCEEVDAHIRWHILHPYEPVHAGPYTVTPLPAKHMNEIPLMQPFCYLIEDGKKSILYLHDTGRALDDVLLYLQKENKKVDLVSFDCTYELNPSGGDKDGHMGVDDNIRLREKLLHLKICHQDTRYVVNHFSHNSGVHHKELCEAVNPQGLEVAFDGMEVKL